MDTVRAAVDSARADYVDNTAWIRRARMASKLREDVHTVIDAIVRVATAGGTRAEPAPLTDADMDGLLAECSESAPTLSKELPVVFTKLMQNRLDVAVFLRQLDELEAVERGEADQESATVRVGEMLHGHFVGGKVVAGNKKEESGGESAAAAAAAEADCANDDENNNKKKKEPTLTWAEHRLRRSCKIVASMRDTQFQRDQNKANLRAAIEKRERARRGEDK